MQTSIGTGLQSQATKYEPRYAAKFDDLAASARRALASALEQGKGVLLRVDAGDLFNKYLVAFPTMQDRQYHHCNCCHSFLRRFGSLVVLTEAGGVRSALWDESLLPARHPYRSVAKALREAVESGPVVDQFLWDERDWGTAEAGGFTHFHVAPAAEHLWMRRDLTAEQAMAARREDRRHLARAVGEMDRDALRRAVGMLRAGELSRGEKLVEWAEWLVALQDAANSNASRHQREFLNRLLWRAVSEAPAGWCTPRSSSLGALVDDLASGVRVAEVVRRHEERMDPLKYQRPTAPVLAGNVAQAECLFDRLGLAPALRRRFATADELVHLWKPRAAPRGQEGGVFGHLGASQRAKAEASLTASPVRVTFSKFRRDVLPRALELEVLVPTHGGFCAYTTQADPSAPPLLQWDSEECRNPFAWYVYHNGSPASNWGLTGGRRARVSCVSLQPTMWSGEDAYAHLGKSALLVLEGCADRRGGSLALFPECLRSELHGVRSTVEAHSRSRSLERPEGQHAAGLRVQDGVELQVWARTADGVARYVIDRWE
jgi:hypothetical protein